MDAGDPLLGCDYEQPEPDDPPTTDEKVAWALAQHDMYFHLAGLAQSCCVGKDKARWRAALDVRDYCTKKMRQTVEDAVRGRLW